MMMMMQYMLLALTGLLAVHAGRPGPFGLPGPTGPRGERPPATKYPRTVTKTLTVPNGRSDGVWKRAEFCPHDTYASGFELKVDWGSVAGDHTALNGISLKCKSRHNDHYQGEVQSGVGQWGRWTDLKECTTLGSTEFYLTCFQLKVERSQGDRDDTAANNINFKCRPLRTNLLYDIEGDGQRWGESGPWSAACPIGSAICGIQTRVENHQCNGDDTALNNVKFFCCQIPNYGRGGAAGPAGPAGPSGPPGPRGPA